MSWVHVCELVYLCAYVWLHTCVYSFMNVYMCVHACMCVSICVHVCRVCVCVCEERVANLCHWHVLLSMQNLETKGAFILQAPTADTARPAVGS